MTPQSLKAAILQLAIQGKLVPQRPEDGSADALLRQIQDEKLHPAKAGTIKKEKPLPEIGEDEIPFEIPASWRWVRLGSIGHTNIGLTYSPKDTSVNGTVVLRSNNIQNGKMDYTDLVRVSLDVPKNKMCQRGDILICARNGSKKLVGKSAIIDQDDMCFGAFMAIFRSQCNEYVFHAINAPYFRNSLLGDAGTTTINQITQDMLKNALIPLPPLPEQHRIVAKIEELLPLVDRYEQAWTKLEDFTRRFPADMQKSLLQMAIQGKLVEQRPEEGTAKMPAAFNTKKKKARRHEEEFEPPFDIPESWRWGRLADISESINVGIVIRPKRYYVSQDEGTPAFRNCNIQQGFIDDREWVYLNADAALENPRAVVKTGDVLIARSGTPGNCCVVTKPYSGRGAVDIVIVRLQQKMANPDYIQAFLCSPFAQQAFLAMSRGVALSHLGATTVASLTVPLPPLAEQKRIVAKLEELLPLCERLK